MHNFFAKCDLFVGDVLKLLDDVAQAKPTIFPAVPRLLNRIYDKILQTVNSSSPIRRFLFYRGLDYKKKLLRRGILRQDTIWDKLVFSKIRARLGGRYFYSVVGAVM